jgi:hypothetical protein
MSIKKNSTSLISSPGSADSALDLNQSDLFGHSHSVNESHIAKPSCESTGPTFQSLTTCEPSQQMDLEELTSSSVASHASPGPKPGSKEARQMTVTSGRKWLGLLKSYGLHGSLARTCEDLLTNQWASSAAFLTWKASATKPSHLLFQLAPWTPRTDATASGLLHTPTSKANQMAPSMRERDAGSWWATPRASDIRDGRTLNEKGQRVSKSSSLVFGANLADQVKLWPTPTASDHKGSGPTVMRKDGKNRLNDRLDYSTEQRQPSGGRLNPTWVEWLMGFPEGWTDLKPSATRSSQVSSRKSGEQYLKRKIASYHS